MSIDNYLYCAEEEKFYKAVDVLPDGSCMFYSFSYCLFGSTSSAQELLNSVANVKRIIENGWLIIPMI